MLETTRTLRLPEVVATQVAIWQFMAARSEIGGIGAIRVLDDERLEVAALWLEADSISSGGHTIENQGVANAFSKHIGEVEDIMVPNTIWHSHPGFTHDFSAIDDANTKHWIAKGKKMFSLVFSSLRKSSARLDWLEGNQHICEPLRMVWVLPTHHEAAARIKAMKDAHIERIRQAAANLSSKQAARGYRHWGRSSGINDSNGADTGWTFAEFAEAYPRWYEYWRDIRALAHELSIPPVEAGRKFFDSEEFSDREFFDFFGVYRDSIL